MNTIKIPRRDVQRTLDAIKQADGVCLGAQVAGDFITLHVLLPEPSQSLPGRAHRCDCDICRETCRDKQA